MHSSPRSLALSRFLLGLPLLASCAGAEPRAKALARPPEDPCDISEASIADIRELDAEFDRKLKAKQAEPRDYGYQFVDDPLGAIAHDGSCECLARRLSGDTMASCRAVLHAAYTCLGGPGSERLVAHRNCVPFNATMSGRRIQVAVSAYGCLGPDLCHLVVTPSYLQAAGSGNGGQ